MSDTSHMSDALKSLNSQHDFLRAAIDRSYAVIEFTTEGIVVDANENFLKTMGYTLQDIKGKHHRMFCDPEETSQPEYRAFWQKLGRGEFDAGEYRRIANNGREIWLQATYSPVCDNNGKPVRVIKLASDITHQKQHDAEFEGKVDAISRAQAVIEFDLKGKILSANENFLMATGYRASEIIGEHHRMFCDEAYTKTVEYRDFWNELARGEFTQGEYRRFRKDGSEIWLQATYNPILDAVGRPYKVVKFATDITQRKLINAEFEGKVNAISRAQAVIEFDLEGHVLNANANFLSTIGYRFDDIRGQHHRMFCEPSHVSSDEYRHFWDELNRGKPMSGEFRRVGRNGREVWLQATYNPILDMDGRPFKIVKFAIDITAQKREGTERESRLKAIDRSQAVIEFDLKGNILTANRNFLHTMGYTLEEVQSQHHRIFCDDDYVTSTDYRDFWQKLSLGEFISGRFCRQGKFGRRVWIQGTYNPIFDPSGQVYKIIKFATDITEQVTLEDSIRDQAASMGGSIVDLNTSINAIAENAQLTQQLAHTTQEEARHGSSTLARSVEVMDAIRKGSDDVDAIVKVIGEIANQTNLLAFNAAIEAARAGEHGLGFSVVADEVRKLAEKSSDATRQINRLLGESSRRIEEGNVVTRDARTSFDKIVDGIEKTSSAVDEITRTTQGQLDNADHVAQAIQRLNAATAYKKSYSAADQGH